MTAPETNPADITSSINSEAGVITISASLRAAPRDVFTALTDPNELAKWWGAADLYRTHQWVTDLRPGGKWSTQAINADGTKSTVGGEYIEVIPPSLLEYTWSPSWDDFAVTRVRCEIEPAPSGTRLNITHTGFDPGSSGLQGTTEGWERVLTWLATWFQSR